MTNFNPKVSIIIPVYNGSQYLGEAIKSALAQTYKNIEIIVVSDGSNDNGATARVAKSFGKKIQFFDKKENGGAATALNLAIKHMTGEYFSWLSHDDLYYPNKVQRQVEELGKLDDKNTIIMSDLDGINEKREKIYQTDYAKHVEAHPPRLKSRIHPVIYNQTHGCTLLIPKVCFDEVGMFNADERVAQDFELFHRAFLRYPHKLVSEVLVTARDTSNRMGRRAKPRASLEYSRLFMGILDNLSNEDIRLLAKDKLALMSDMWSFFKAAGYLQADEYITKKIIEHVEPFCKDKISEFTNKTIGRQELAGELNRIRDQLSLVMNDKEKSDMFVDNGIRRIITDLGNKYFTEDTERAITLHDTLAAVGCKISAATLIKLIVLFLSESKQTEKLNKTVIAKITGHESFATVKTPSNKKNIKPVIAFCSTHWLTGGMERVMSILFEHIKQRYDIILITPFDGRSADIKIPDGVKHIKISNSKFQTEYESSVLSIALINNVDVIVGVYNLYNPQLNLYKLCREVGIKTVASNHENFFYPYFNYGLQEIAFKRLETFKKVDAVVWPTNYSAAVSGLGSPNSYLMPNPNTFKPVAVKSKTDEHAVICVGRFNDYIKRADRILQTFKLIQDRVPQSKLFLVGDCDRTKKNESFGNKSVDDMVFELGIDENNLVFTGNIPNVEDYYRRASVLLLTSDSEGFGMVINEAASFGVPTVYNEISGLDDLIVDGKNGFVVKQGDLVTMADKVTEILTDKKLADRMSGDALALSKRFDAAVIGNKWAYLIDTLLETNSSADLKVRLDKELAYTTKGTELSRQIFDELGKVSKRLVNLQINTPAESYSPGKRYSRLVISIEKEGKKRTTKKIIRKVFYKAGAETIFEHGLILNRSLRHHGIKGTARKIYKKTRLRL